MWRPFSNNSPWNTKISENPEIDPNSDKMIADLFKSVSKGKIYININNWSIPVFYVNEKKTKWVDIHYSYFHKFCHPQLLKKAPIPKEAFPDPKEDAHLCIVNNSKTLAWDMWGVKKIEGKWVIKSGRKWNLKGSGVLKPGEGACRASGFPLLAGLIRYDEIKDGKINHALVFAYDYPKRGVYVYPASISDGMGTRPGAIPEGARLQLNPSLDISRLNLKPAARIIAKALQEYGMFLGDGAGGIALYAENFVGRPKNLWKGILKETDLLGIPVEEFRVLKLPKLESKGIPLDWPTDKMKVFDRYVTDKDMKK
jgi:hypothetical protein